jgi:hypothetical protein
VAFCTPQIDRGPTFSGWNNRDKTIKTSSAS